MARWGSIQPQQGTLPRNLDHVGVLLAGPEDPVAWPKDLQVKFESHEAVFKILQWSFQALFEGRMPSHRHDGTPWTATDTFRRRSSGKTLPKAVLAELRGDWAMLKQVLDMPGWQDEYICFRCNIRRSQLHEVAMTAPWRLFVLPYC